jgi:hypothetical protein
MGVLPSPHVTHDKTTIQSYKPVAALSSVHLETLPTLDYLPFPVAAPGTYANLYEPGNCTWLAASMKQHVPNSWGNANTWAQRAAEDGYTVSATPMVGAVAQTSAGYYGHVAVVEEVGEGRVKVIEMNVRGLGVIDEAWYPVSIFTYIYV